MPTRNRTSAKKAGSAFESLVEEELAGLGAFRKARNGNKDQGDIHLHDVPWFVIECKNTARVDLAGWHKELSVEIANASAQMGAIVHKRHGKGAAGAQWVTMDLDTLRRLLALAVG